MSKFHGREGKLKTVFLKDGRLPREEFTKDEMRILSLSCTRLDVNLRAQLDNNSLREVLLVDHEDLIETAEKALSDLCVKRIMTYENGYLKSTPCIERISYYKEILAVTLNKDVFGLINSLLSH